jgi:hypothetical protein
MRTLFASRKASYGDEQKGKANLAETASKVAFEKGRFSAAARATRF